jgi:hypothetical protein
MINFYQIQADGAGDVEEIRNLSPPPRFSLTINLSKFTYITINYRARKKLFQFTS